MGDLLIVGGLVFGQIMYGSLSVFWGQLLAMGCDALFLVTLKSLTAFIVLSPFAFFGERRNRPSAISFRLLIKFVFLALGGVALFQALLLMGIKKTSPAIATATANLIPGLVFVIAGILRLEKVDFGCRYSWIKILGTLLCVFGAIAMNFLRRPETVHQQNISAALSNMDTVVGGIYILAAFFILSCVMILQANTLKEYPAPMSMCAITALMGSFFTAALQLARDHRMDPGTSSLSLPSLFGITLVMGVVNAACFSIQGWSVGKRGPVFVSMFTPIGTVCSAILSSFFGHSLNMGSILGMSIIFVGLYLVLWAKKREGLPSPVVVVVYDEEKIDKLERHQEVTKPLIS